MIATLTGKISEKLNDKLIIDVNGVGYGLYVTLDDSSKLELNQNTKLYVYEHVREQSYELFGFTSRDIQNLFEQLLEVNGVGPKMALNLLSIGSASDVRRAIAEGDFKFIQRANGVGKRVAERVVIELKDKVGLIASDLGDSDIFRSNVGQSKDDAVEALIALGFSPNDAIEAFKSIDKDLPTEERIRLALKGASNERTNYKLG
jgi:Holliday junction DNA helicase RuvA